VFTATASLVINIVLNLLLIPRMGIAGLALSGALSAWANCAMLYVLLHRRGHFHVERDLGWRIARIVLSAAAMGAVIVWIAGLLAPHFGGSVVSRVWSLAVLLSSGGVVYFGLAWLTGAIDRSKISMLTRKTPVQD